MRIFLAYTALLLITVCAGCSVTQPKSELVDNVSTKYSCAFDVNQGYREIASEKYKSSAQQIMPNINLEKIEGELVRITSLENLPEITIPGNPISIVDYEHPQYAVKFTKELSQFVFNDSERIKLVACETWPTVDEEYNLCLPKKYYDFVSDIYPDEDEQQEIVRFILAHETSHWLQRYSQALSPAKMSVNNFFMEGEAYESLSSHEKIVMDEHSHVEVDAFAYVLMRQLGHPYPKKMGNFISDFFMCQKVPRKRDREQCNRMIKGRVHLALKVKDYMQTGNTSMYKTLNGAGWMNTGASTCSSSVIKLDGFSQNQSAWIITNGHCIKGPRQYPDPDKIFHKEAHSGSVYINNDKGVVRLKYSELIYGTLKGIDIAIYKLASSYKDLKALGIEAHSLSRQKARLNEAVEVVSGAWLANPTCNIESIVPQLKEGPYLFVDSYRLSRECKLIDGFSGSMVKRTFDGTIVGLFNTWNESGESCLIENPCELRSDGGTAVVKKNFSYASPLDGIYGCINDQKEFDLKQSGCALPKN